MSPGLTSNLNPTPNKIKVLSLVEAAILPLYLEMESDKKVALLGDGKRQEGRFYASRLRLRVRVGVGLRVGLRIRLRLRVRVGGE